MADDAIDVVCAQLHLPYALKPPQRHVIKYVLSEQHVLGLLPTGFGKSDCYGLVPFIKDQLTATSGNIALIVSPLRSLMIDQVERYKLMGINALAILRREEVSSEQEEDLRMGRFPLVFTSPEAIFLQPWCDIIRKLKNRICVLAIDEAHCLSSWGNDFRKAYQRVVELRSVLSKTPICMLTATATQPLISDLLEILCLSTQEVKTVAVLPDRPNIFLDMKRVSRDITENLAWLVEETKRLGDRSPKTIIYARTIDSVASLYGGLVKMLGADAWHGERSPTQARVQMFHGSTDGETQEFILTQFTGASPLRIVVATVAFGLGVQVKDVDRVIHWGASKNILSYWQECGRAARDGRSGKAHLYLPPYGLHSLYVSEEMIQLVNEVENHKSCIRKAILTKLFVEGMDPKELDNCSNNPRCCCNCVQLQ